jgi:uncharacterized protein YqgC (DUF456 family)
MTESVHLLEAIATGGVYLLIVLLGLVALVLSAVSLSGTWLVVLAALLALALPDRDFPGLATVLVFLLIAALVEGAEFLAGTWGVRRRGGSALAGVAALVGGLVGLFVGTLIPIPVVGSLLGMMAGAFGLVYVVERRRLQRADAAAHIAWGTVLSRIAVIVLKVGVTLAMLSWLGIGLARS